MHIKKIISSLKGLFFLLSTLFLLLTFNISNSFADFYVIAGSKGVGTKITSLPKTISSSGFYFIDKDLSCATGTHGITITADNVTLDLMGFSLIGPGGTSVYDGIYMHTRTNVEIRNGTIRNFGNNGITEAQEAGTSHRIINIRFHDNTGYATYLRSTGNLIEKCTAVNNGIGFYSSFSSTITGNTCYNNDDYGISVYMGSTVIGNTCYDNGANGITVSTGSTVANNTCYSNNQYGISAGLGSTVIGNTCYANLHYGIYLQGYNLVDQNTAYVNLTGDIYYSVTCVYGTNNPSVFHP